MRHDHVASTLIRRHFAGLRRSLWHAKTKFGSSVKRCFLYSPMKYNIEQWRFMPLHRCVFAGSQPLRKHTYSNILRISHPKNEKFQIKNSDIFHISAQNIDCGYSLEPTRGGSNECPNLCFRAKIEK